MRFALALAICVLGYAGNCEAWNGRGHMIVAAVAWRHLTPQAQARASDLLKLNPFYADWIKDVPTGEQNEIAFVTAATWPDLIKKWKGSCPRTVSDNSGDLAGYTYCNDSDKPTHAGADQNTGYVDRLEHKYWHFVDLPFSPDGTPLKQPTVPNARTQIEAFRTAIGSTTTSDAVKSYDLVWLEHLVGDVHQPLHVTSRFTKTLRAGDQGANLVCMGKKLSVVKGKKKCISELHAFWDNALGLQKSKVPTFDNARAAIAVADTLPAASQTDAAEQDDGVWIDESFAIAKQSVYVTPIKNGIGPYQITAKYKANATAIAKTQAEIAGERLANLLNNNLR